VRLRQVRLRKALTQQQLAQKAGINRVTVARLEAGKDQPFPTTVRKLADALGVEPEALAADSLRPGPHGANGRFDVPAPLRANSRMTVTDEVGVNRLLHEHPELAALVREAADQLVNRFPNAPLRLRVLADPDEGGEQLFLAISADYVNDAALAALDRFDQEWWIHNANRGGGLLCIDLSDG